MVNYILYAQCGHSGAHLCFSVLAHRNSRARWQLLRHSCPLLHRWNNSISFPASPRTTHIYDRWCVACSDKSIWLLGIRPDCHRFGIFFEMAAITMPKKASANSSEKRFGCEKQLLSIRCLFGALRKILSEPGMHLSKVAVLIGAQIGLRAFSQGSWGCLYHKCSGSTPIIFLIIPCVDRSLSIEIAR